MNRNVSVFLCMLFGLFLAVSTLFAEKSNKLISKEKLGHKSSLKEGLWKDSVNDLILELAIFPCILDSDDGGLTPIYEGVFSKLTRRFWDAVINSLRYARGIEIKYSYQKLDQLKYIGKSPKPITIRKDTVWHKSSFWSPMKPNIKDIIKYGRQIEVDIVFLCRIKSDKIRIYIVDIDTEKLHEYFLKVEWAGHLDYKDPSSKVTEIIKSIKWRKDIQLAEQIATKEIKETSRELQKLKDETESDKEPTKGTAASKVVKKKIETAPRDHSKDQKIAKLEDKLSNLTDVLAELDKLKKQLGNERMRAGQLSEKLSMIMKEKETLKERMAVDTETRKQLEEERKRTELLSRKLNEITEEKETLKKKLDNEVDVKNALETALKDRESTSKTHENLKTALYEKERQLKSTSFQLDDTVRKSKETRDKLIQLLEREQELSKLLKQKETQKETVSGKYQAELEDLQAAKKTLESEADTLRSRETKLLNEMESLKELAKKTKNEADTAKHELEDMRKREAQLIGQLNEMKEKLDKGAAPVVVVSQPKNGSKMEIPTTLLHLVAVDDRGIQSIRATLNGKPITLENTRGTRKDLTASPKAIKKLDLSARLKLEYGENVISVSVKDTDGTLTKESIRVSRVKSKGKIWAAIIGINQYPHTRNLKYAVNDALGFKTYLEEYIGLPKENIFYLTDQNATKYEIESLLGTKLKRKASKDDTVFIFYAGHGAVETDPVDPDGDGFEKYLLPYDARLDDLYTTAISMNDVRTIFQRNRAQRLVFIADTCYSGASGGRSMLTSKTRATLSDQFFERVSKGKGRVIISACSANEVSQEDDRLKHGIFSYYLLEGLKGKSDINGDNVITISELFSYLSRKVPKASGQDQHPVKKGETEGELVIGYVK